MLRRILVCGSLVLAVAVGGCDSTSTPRSEFAADRRRVARMFRADASAWRKRPASGIRSLVAHTDPATREASGTNVEACSGALRGLVDREFIPKLSTMRADPHYRERFSGKRPSGRVYALRGRASIVQQGSAIPHTQGRSTHVVIVKQRAYFFNPCRESSPNWSGWIGTVKPASGSVVGSWIVPAGQCPARGRRLVWLWIGLGGHGSQRELEQVGTQTQCSDGRRATVVVTEHGNDRTIVHKSIHMQPGDRIDAAVTRRYDEVRVTLDVNGIRQLATTLAPPLGATASAECIVERPLDVQRHRPDNLVPFGRARFLRCKSNETGRLESANPRKWFAAEIFGSGRRLTVTGFPNSHGGFEVRQR